MSDEITLYLVQEAGPATLFTPTPRAAKRLLEFFTAQINNGSHAPGVPECHAPLRALV
jgi:hypothetical protein